MLPLPRNQRLEWYCLILDSLGTIDVQIGWDICGPTSPNGLSGSVPSPDRPRFAHSSLIAPAPTAPGLFKIAPTQPNARPLRKPRMPRRDLLTPIDGCSYRGAVKFQVCASVLVSRLRRVD